MKTVDRLFLAFFRLFPKKTRENFEHLMIYAGMHESPGMFMGKMMFFGMLISAIILLFPFVLYGRFVTEYIVTAILNLLLTPGLSYLFVFFKAEDRTKKTDIVLPDLFQMIAANLRAGMTPYKSLKAATTEDEGPLQDEIRLVTSKAIGTGSFTENLMGISKRIQSSLLEKSLKLFTTAMRSGGRLANLLEELANEISETQALKNELKTSTKTYTAFIIFTVIFGTPLLLAISVNFVDMISSMQAKTNIGSTDFGMGSLMSEIPITPLFLNQLSIISLIMTSIFASMLIGVINEGEYKSGLKYAPLIMIACLTIFLLSKGLVANYLVGMN